MSRFIYCVAHILATSIIFIILSSLAIYLFSELYFDGELISTVIFLAILTLMFLVSFIAGKRMSVWLRRKGNFKVTVSLIFLQALIILSLVSYLLLLPQKQKLLLEPPQSELPASELPEFPLPAPPASATIVLPEYFFDIGEEDKIVYLSDVNQTLDRALNSAGYLEKSYYSVVDGFALVTRLEQINFDGTPKRNSERWAIEVAPLRYFSLRRYLNALFTANPGYYRIIVFIVTPHPFSQKGDEITRDEALAWLREGLNTLPRSIGKQVYSDEYTSTALIYEFDQPSGFEQEEVNLKIPGRLQGKTHLLKAGIWSALEK